MADSPYGYDLPFVTKPPEYLHCFVCHLVLRDPIMFVACGHKCCTPCFKRLKDHSNNKNIDLKCPVDTSTIDPTKIVEDLGLRRVIGSLLVKCMNSENGCTWEGELTEIQVHMVKCKVLQNGGVTGNAALLEVVKSLESRIEACEKQNKEKDQIIKNLRENNFSMNGEIAALREFKEEFKFRSVKMGEEIGAIKMVQKMQEDKDTSLRKELEMLHQELIKMKMRELRGPGKTAPPPQSFAQAAVHFPAVPPPLPSSPQATMARKEEVVKKTGDRDEKLKNFNSDKFNEKPKVLNNEKSFARQDHGGVVNRRKKDFLETISGDSSDASILDGVHVTFLKNLSIVAAPFANVTRGAKVYYEVTFYYTFGKSFEVRVGWANDRIKTSNGGMVDGGLGSCKYGWAFCVSGETYHGGVRRKWGKAISEEASNHQVLGVAVDMGRGEMYVTWNGLWNPPMGLAFTNVSGKHVFPAMSGQCTRMTVNFGETPFKYLPPDDAYHTVAEL